VVTDNKSWEDAGAYCRQLNSAAHLVVINDDVEMKALHEKIRSMSSLYMFLSCFVHYELAKLGA